MQIFCTLFDGWIVMDHFQRIYAEEAERYERMVAREDYRGNLFAALNEIIPLDGLDVVEFGAGTGRITRLMSFQARRVIATDAAPAMLKTARHSLELSGMENWHLLRADNRRMPFAAASADLVIEGWSFAHAVGWHPDSWREEIASMLNEMQRLLRPGGTAILIETLGTGQRTPMPPNEGLAELYAWWEAVHGFKRRWIRTDYQFASVEEADELTRFFFGNDLANQLTSEGRTLLPECTGLWSRTYP